jgi:hypothetical protein
VASADAFDLGRVLAALEDGDRRFALNCFVTEDFFEFVSSVSRLDEHLSVSGESSEELLNAVIRFNLNALTF